jgi:IS4 transposase
MLFCQLGHAKSLREICGGLAASEGKLRHLGVPAAPARSTLAYANEHRPWQLQRSVFEQLLAKCQTLAAHQSGTRKKRKFRFKNPLMSLDATVIDLCAQMFDWAKFRRTKGAVKLHLLLDHDGYLPSFAVISEGKTHEVRVARQLHFAPGTILIFDRGYTDYQWFTSLTQQGVYFVTRLKENADYGVVEKREVSQGRSVLRDEVIFFYKLAQENQEVFYRRIEFYDQEHDRVLVFVTNHPELAATTITAIYKERWQVELFFRALKQSLRVKTFVGTSPNALKTQLWTALIAMLLVKYLQLRSTFGWSLSNLVALLRQQLFVYRDLWTWIDDPFQPPPIPPSSPEQLTLQLV